MSLISSKSFIISTFVSIFLIATTANASSSNAAADYAPQLYAYVDSSNELTIHDIVDLPDNRFKKAPAAGYVGGYNRYVHWLRFTLPAADVAEKTRILRVQPTYTDYVTLYIPNPIDHQQPSYSVIESGEFGEDLVAKVDRAFTFELTTRTEPQTLYIRLQSLNSNTLVAKYHQPADYIATIEIETLLAGLFMGLLLTFITINLGYGKWRSDRSFRYYLMFLSASLLVFLANNGWLTLYLPSSWLPWTAPLQQLSTILYLATLALLYHALFKFSRQTSPIQYWFSISYFVIAFIGIVVFVMGFYTEYVPNLLSATIVYLLVIAGIALKRAFKGQTEERLLLLAVILGFSGILGTALSLRGLLSGGVWLLYSYTLGTFTSIVVFQSIMSRRMRLIEQHHLTTLLDKEYAEQMVARERAEKEQKAQFISMLSHELKTPLSVIQMGIARPTLSDMARRHTQQAIKDMAMVIDRCAVLEKVDDQVHAHLQSVALAQELNHLIADSHFAKRIQFHAPADNIVLTTDPDWLRVIINNLLDNALKYSPTDSPIELSLATQNDMAMVTLTNTSDHLELDPQVMFDKYHRGQSARKQTGSGVGLYIVKQLVNQLGGTIDCQVSQLSDHHLLKVSMTLCLPRTL